jgi:uncharacterized protein (UPF0254 family)
MVMMMIKGTRRLISADNSLVMTLMINRGSISTDDETVCKLVFIEIIELESVSN